MTTLLIRERIVGGGLDRRARLEVDHTQITLRDIILARVASEVADYNSAAPGTFVGLIAPLGAEQQSSSEFIMERGRLIDVGTHQDAAIKAFEDGRFLVLVRDRQIVDLDEEVDLGGTPELTFIKLVPLIGG